MSYRSSSQQTLQLDKICDNHYKYHLTQYELREINKRSGERCLFILKWRKYGKENPREVTTDSDSHLPERQRKAQRRQTNSQNDEPSETHKPSYNRQKTYNLRDRSNQRAAKIEYQLFQIQKNNNKAAEIPNMDKKVRMTLNKVTI